MSRPPRFFITADQISGGTITVKEEDVRHIATVLRMRSGEELLLCDGDGTDYTVRIDRIERGSIETSIVGRSQRAVAVPRITLGQGLPKSDKMDWIVQKATELGAATIVPLITERTVVKIREEEKRVGRWQKIAREAAMQSNRPDIPRIDRVRSLREFISTLDAEPSDLLLFPWEEGATRMKSVLRQASPANHVIVIIGPEGGFSSSEAEAAKGKGFHLVSLGLNILRTETAAVAALSMIGYECF